MWPNSQFQRIWSHLLKKSLMKNLIFCALLNVFLLRCSKAVSNIDEKNQAVSEAISSNFDALVFYAL